MKVLLIGSGGREHALATALSESKSLEKLYVCPGNPGILKMASHADVNITDHHQVIEFCKSKSIDLVVVGPEQPLADGLADSLTETGINVFGPSKNAAMLEASKVFAKDFMIRYNIPTANYRQFHKFTEDEAHLFIDALEAPVVLKADGLAGGKGVIIAETHTEAHNALDNMFDGLFDSAGETVVIEEFMSGEEASVLAVCDGTDFITLASAQDHKRIYDDDKGPNTGGMGAYSPAPIVTDEILNITVEKIIKPTLKGMADEHHPFIGCLYVGLMINGNDVKVVEFNVRFGDPETEAVLPLFKGDFAELLLSAAKGKLDKSKVETVCSGYSCSVILASEGYPGSFDKGNEITGIEKAEADGAIVFQAGTALKDGKLVNNGGRVIAVTGKGDDLKSAIDNAYKYVNHIKYENKFYRTDIGKKGLKK